MSAYFDKLSKSKLKEISRRGGSRRPKNCLEAWQDADRIKELYKRGHSYRDLAIYYNVSHQTIKRIVKS